MNILILNFRIRWMIYLLQCQYQDRQNELVELAAVVHLEIVWLSVNAGINFVSIT